jgi:hypothetical protein
MSRRAASLVVLAGFFTLATGLLVAQAPRKAIKTASDLPAFSYPVTGSQDDVIRSEDVRRPPCPGSGSSRPDSANSRNQAGGSRGEHELGRF